MRQHLLAVVLAAALLPAGSAHGTTATMAGFGEMTPPGCEPGALKMPLEGQSDGGPVWLTVRPFSVGVECPAIVLGTMHVFVGNWKPERGGCLSSIMSPGVSLCVGPVRTVLTPTVTSLSLCFQPSPPACWSGTATLVRSG